MSLLSSLKTILSFIAPQKRRRVWLLFILMLFGGIAEALSIGSILPFLYMLTLPNSSSYTSVTVMIEAVAGPQGPIATLTVIMSFFAFLATLSAVIQLSIIYVGQKQVLDIASEVSVKVYDKIIRQPYSFYLANNHSEMLAMVGKGQQLSGLILLPVLSAVTSLIIAVMIIAGLIVLRPLTSLLSILFFSSLYLAAIAFSRKRLARQGEIIAQTQGEIMKVATDGLGGIRDVLLDRSQNIFTSRFAAVDQRVRRAQAFNGVFLEFPRYAIEGIAMVALAILAVSLSVSEGGISGAVPVVAMLSVATLRLVPLVQNVYRGWASLMTGQPILKEVLAILRMPDYPPADGLDHLRFENKIVFDQVGFRYQANAPDIISGLYLEIPKGSRVGIAGKTGIGKSTLTDILMGLLVPTSGQIMIDDVKLNEFTSVAWQRHVAHVPQHIFLADAPLSENIAFGVPPDLIDLDRVKLAAEQAQLMDVVNVLPNSFDTKLGERGIRLSGGQRQRVGIARALYKQADLLVLDEATSSLDHETEKSVIEAITRLDNKKTIIMIAHRVTTLDQCDFIIRLSENNQMTIEIKKPN